MTLQPQKQVSALTIQTSTSVIQNTAENQQHNLAETNLNTKSQPARKGLLGASGTPQSFPSDTILPLVPIQRNPEDPAQVSTVP